MKVLRLLILISLVVNLSLNSCNEMQQKRLPMQSALDSMAMWYQMKQIDSMNAATQRVASYLRKHENDKSEPTQRLRSEWLHARGVQCMVIEGRPDSGLIYTQQALKEMEGLQGIDKERIFSMANEADCYRQLGQLAHSADCYLQALEMADATGQADTTKIALMLGISTVYSFMGDYQNSKMWWERTSKLVGQMEKADQFIYYNNVGNDHYFQQHYPEARDFFKKAIEIVRGDKQKEWDYYMALGNLGEIYVCLGQADSARALITEADSFFRKVKFQPFLYYLETEKIELALLEGRTQEALKMVEHCEFKDVVIPAAKLLRLKAEEQVMRQAGYHLRANEIHLAYHLINDSLQDDKARMQMNTKLLQYEHNKRLLEQERTIEYERMSGRLGWALLIVALLAITLLVTLIWIWRRRQRIREIMVHQQIIAMRMENTRQRISPHFIYNALTHEMLAQMDGRKVNLDALTQLLRRGVEQAKLLDTTLTEELTFVNYYIDIERQQMSQNFEYIEHIADDVQTDVVRVPAMTIQILVENAIKHGLHRKGGKLTIRTSRQNLATLVEVMDDGQGLEANFEEHTGLKVIRQTIQMLNEHNSQQITFGIESLNPGCRAWLLIPDDYDYNIATI